MADTAKLSPLELRNIGLFGALSDDVLTFLVGMLTVVEPAVGETIFREGDEPTAMYVVLAGEMEVTKKSRGGVDARVAVLGPGDWFGEMSIVDIQPRSATVRTLAPGRLIRVTASPSPIRRHASAVSSQGSRNCAPPHSDWACTNVSPTTSEVNA